MNSPKNVGILAVADSDSYLKWSAGLLDTVPSKWQRHLVVVRNPIAPSQSQIDAAISGTRFADGGVDTLSMRRLKRLLADTRPDVVLIATTGPTADVLINEVFVHADPRPVLISGLPGISIPATERALQFRRNVDLFVLQSKREVSDFRKLAKVLNIDIQITLATLPSLAPRSSLPHADLRDTVVFAPQALVPPAKEDRQRILLALAELADNHPDLTPVVKLRAAAGEGQTHRERLNYVDLWEELCRDGRVRRDSLVFRSGNIHDHLRSAYGFVTVSSTAALEAVSHGVDALILTDFGLNEEMINVVFTDSRLLGTLDDLAHAKFHQPAETWLDHNYFHADHDTTWLSDLRRLIGQRQRHQLPDITPISRSYVATQRYRRARLRLRVHPNTRRLITLIARLHPRVLVRNILRLSAD